MAAPTVQRGRRFIRRKVGMLGFNVVGEGLAIPGGFSLNFPKALKDLFRINARISLLGASCRGIVRNITHWIFLRGYNIGSLCALFPRVLLVDLVRRSCRIVLGFFVVALASSKGIEILLFWIRGCWQVLMRLKGRLSTLGGKESKADSRRDFARAIFAGRPSHWDAALLALPTLPELSLATHYYQTAIKEPDEESL